jgi:hypothetical protein
VGQNSISTTGPNSDSRASRAMSATDAPGRTASATIRRFSSSDHERRDRLPPTEFNIGFVIRSNHSRPDILRDLEIAVRRDNVHLTDHGHLPALIRPEQRTLQAAKPVGGHRLTLTSDQNRPGRWPVHHGAPHMLGEGANGSLVVAVQARRWPPGSALTLAMGLCVIHSRSTAHENSADVTLLTSR